MRRLRQHVNPLRHTHLRPGAGPIEVPRRMRLEVELGCADARWLFERAKEDAAAFLVGIEIRREWVDAVQARAQRQGLGDRLQAVYANITTDIAGLFAPSAVERFIVNFPDPWFKRRHKKRRVLTAEVATVLAAQLRPGGELFFQSDVWDVALEAMAVLEAMAPSLENAWGAWTFCKESPYAAQSRRELGCLEQGRPIWRLLYRKGVSGLPARSPRAL